MAVSVVSLVLGQCLIHSKHLECAKTWEKKCMDELPQCLEHRRCSMNSCHIVSIYSPSGWRTEMKVVWERKILFREDFLEVAFELDRKKWSDLHFL
jgi:hypothetical protein